VTLVVAHRGAGADAPENTMTAYKLAVAMGADAIEVDVHLTADGQLALIHDDTLDRTTNKTGHIAAFTMDEIRAANAGYRFKTDDGKFPFRRKRLRVPTLPEVLEWLPEPVLRGLNDSVGRAPAGLQHGSDDAAAPRTYEERGPDRPVPDLTSLLNCRNEE